MIERHVHNHLYAYMTANDQIYNRQSGFRQFHSTETALIKLIDQLLFDMYNNRITGMVLVDYQKAFDMVDHCLLLSKLEIYGLDDHALQWITSYLHNRRQCVQLNDVQSSMQNVPHGIPQGSILGPLFFVIFINDLPMHIDNAEVDLFADDTTLSASVDYTEIQQLRKTMDESNTGFNDWAVANKMTLNQKKTKAMLITGKRLSAKTETKVSDLQYEQVSSAKLLGLHIDEELTFNEHVHAICKKLAKRIGTLKRIKGCLPMHQRLLYYNHVINPIMMYSSAVWTNWRKDYLDMVFK